MPSADDELLSMRQVSSETGLPLNTLRYWRSHDQGPRSFRLGGSVRYRRSDLEEWISAQEQQTAAGGA